MNNPVWTYHHRTTIHFGCGALATLPDVAAKLTAGKRIMLVTGNSGSMKKAGVTDKIIEMFGKSNVAVFDQVPPNPTAAVLHQGVNFHKEHGCRLIIGLGGGSPLDAAKGIAVMLHNDGDVSDYLLKKKEWGPGAEPVIAIPTTSGTGSEVNANFVATVPEGNAKYGTAPMSAWPAAAIIDPELTLSLPPHQTASTGLDALSHALEALWAVRGQPISDTHAFEAIKIIMKWLPIAFRDGSNIEAREQMAYASMSASLAFGNTGTAALHAMTYILTTKWNLPHGFACAFIMPELLEYNLPSFSQDRKTRLLDAINAKNEAEAVSSIRELCLSLGAPKQLRDIGVSDTELGELVSSANPFNLANNINKPGDNSMLQIWKKKL